MENLRKMTNFALGKMLDLGEQNSQESKIRISTESFANFLEACNPLRTNKLNK